MLPLLPREIKFFNFPEVSPSTGSASELAGLDSLRFDEDIFRIGAKASLRRPAGEGLRRAEGGASRVCDLESMLTCERSGRGGTGGTALSVSTSSACIEGEERVKYPVCEW